MFRSLIYFNVNKNIQKNAHFILFFMKIVYLCSQISMNFISLIINLKL